jgi:hypothetical protein
MILKLYPKVPQGEQTQMVPWDILIWGEGGGQETVLFHNIACHMNYQFEIGDSFNIKWFYIFLQMRWAVIFVLPIMLLCLKG